MRNKKGQFTFGKSEFIGQIRKKIQGKGNPNWKEKIDMICFVCKKNFLVHPCRLNTAKICSMKCRGAYFGILFEGNKSSSWRGDNISYIRLHTWIKQKLGTPIKCQFCGKEKTTPKSIHWANKSHNYKRILTDWISLCASCHKKYDNEFRNKKIK